MVEEIYKMKNEILKQADIELMNAVRNVWMLTASVR